MNPIQQLIVDYHTRQAFWAAAENVEHDATHQAYFLNLLRARNNVVLLQEDLPRIRELAEARNPYMQYALARLHDCLQFQTNSNEEKQHYYSSAYLLGHIADARSFLAMCYRDGDFGEADVPLYRNIIQKAADEGSEKALMQVILDRMYGQYGLEKDLEEAYSLLQHITEKAQADHRDIDPQYYRLMADCEILKGWMGNAFDNYEKASRLGDRASFFWLAYYSCCDDNGYVDDREEFMRIKEQARDVYTPESFLEYAMMIDNDFYEDLSDDDKAVVHRCLHDDLQAACSLGENIAALYLAGFYEAGECGFPQDYAEAWRWYSVGANLHSASCYEGLARMVLDDHTAPERYDAAYGYECAYKALMLSGNTLETVVQGYHKGFLDSHRPAIEQTYLPRYEQMMKEQLEREQDIDDAYDDSHEYLADA
jgi:TPR repeat protein